MKTLKIINLTDSGAFNTKILKILKFPQFSNLSPDGYPDSFKKKIDFLRARSMFTQLKALENDFLPTFYDSMIPVQLQ